jgi:hypothetical protein
MYKESAPPSMEGSNLGYTHQEFSVVYLDFKCPLADFQNSDVELFLSVNSRLLITCILFQNNSLLAYLKHSVCCVHSLILTCRLTLCCA